MADKPLKSLTFPGLTDRYVIPQIDSSLETAGMAADAKAVGDELEALTEKLEGLTFSINANGNLIMEY